MHLLGLSSPTIAGAAKNLLNCGGECISAGMAGVGVPMGPLRQHIAIDPVQRRWQCLPVGVTWGPPHLSLPILHITFSPYGKGETQWLPQRE